ncbi:hypothetical protein FNF29_08359 [Cafeteria roenbergensis]|uniref:Uncharacterized protein n=1 Tax=Cafeteria roenbergensis TaxID=33653 RepID=A0A5A8BYS9_CAFRO|nr:hypothetical protein FNF29_08359 [Cafeteria roenbergensis]|eukprot:KAA0145873.1 hypothetical protein FNF29_08359 [Cafeteria roenbergensis]
MAQPGVRIAGYPLPLGHDDWAVAPLLCFWSGSSIQITAAFRFFASVARRTEAGLPFGRTAGASVTSTFLRASATRPQPLATSTLASYYHNVLRLADLMLSPIDSHATSRLRNRQPVSASDLVAALLAANPYLRQHRISPHSFRISAATWLLRHSSVTKDRIVVLGRWRNAQSVESYFRESASAHLLSSTDRSAMP